jgi:hypothetical protein
MKQTCNNEIIGVPGSTGSLPVVLGNLPSTLRAAPNSHLNHRRTVVGKLPTITGCQPVLP